MKIIPKIIHYCWFGGNELPIDVKSRIEHWKKLHPEFEFILWDESNFDVNSHLYTKEAYGMKKYAFVTDYVRLFVLKKYGGIYMDTDVDVVKKLDEFLIHGAFTGCESDRMCVTGIIGAQKEHPWIEMLLHQYDNKRFNSSVGDKIEPNTSLITRKTIEIYGWKQKNVLQELDDNLVIYPFEVFCAKDWETGTVYMSEMTHTVHNFSGSWLSIEDKKRQKIKRKIKNLIRKMLGKKNYNKIMNIIQKI